MYVERDSELESEEEESLALAVGARGFQVPTCCEGPRRTKALTSSVPFGRVFGSGNTSLSSASLRPQLPLVSESNSRA